MAQQSENTSHGEVLASTSIIGGSTVIVLLIRMVRTKVMAVLLGPAGIGLEALYDSIVSVGRAAANLGISSSGVRQIAAASGSGDQVLVARTAFTLRRTSLLLGIVGAFGLFLTRYPVSQLTFGNADHASDIGLLSLVLLCGCVMGGQGALLQGMRRIGDLAKMNILGAIAGTVIGIPIVYIWGRDGIPSYLAIVALTGLIVSWIYARRIALPKVEVSSAQVATEVGNLLKLGLVFLSSALMTAGALLLIRVFVTNQAGIDGAGQFQAANALSLVYVSVVLQAMGTDFYPRLTAVADDNVRCNRLVNEQAEVSLLLTLPGVLVTVALAPWIIYGFYSRQFDQAAEILCWQVAGMVFRVAAWPMGYIIVAKGRATIFFLSELVAYSVYALLAWLGLRWFGLPGVGIAFLGLNVFHWCLMLLVARRISGFAWSSNALRLSFMGVGATAVTLGSRLVMAEPWATGVGCALTLVAGVFCLKMLVTLVGREKAERYFNKWRMPFWVRRAFRNQDMALPVP